MIRAVFFDAGETLLYPHPSFVEIFAGVCAAAGHAVTADQVRSVRERLAPHLLDVAEESGVEQGPSLSPEDSRRFWTFLYRRFLEELGVDHPNLIERLYATFSTTSTYRLFDDALPALRAIQQQDLIIGLISNFDSWLTEMLVELQVGHLFDVTVISGVEGVEKPDPAIYRLALERGGVAAEESVHVGDSPSMDAAPALEAGMQPVLLDREGRYPSAPWPTIPSLMELPAILARL